tara:strand:- start:2580 stop:2840 length:261 start_codon:yes stop_codon:yes gene_type:complete
MPKYYYECKNCDVAIEIIHPITDKKYDCEACEVSGSLNRIPFPVTTISKKPNQKQKPGELVDRFIKEASEEIKAEKRQYKEEEYKE